MSGTVDEGCTGHEAADLEDVKRSIAGDETAYARLVGRYQHLVARQMTRFTRDHDAIEELTQEVFVQAYFSLPNYRADAPFLHWLRVIATRTGYRYWRRERRERERRDALETEARAARRRGGGVAAPGEAEEYVYHVLEALGPEDRLVLTLHYLEGCDMKEIASRMGWSHTLVKVRAHRARKKLRAMLAEGQIEEPNDA